MAVFDAFRAAIHKECSIGLLWAHFGRSLHVSEMTANWGRAAFQADEYILGIIVNFVTNKLPFSVTWLAYSSGFFP